MHQLSNTSLFEAHGTPARQADFVSAFLNGDIKGSISQLSISVRLQQRFL